MTQQLKWYNSYPDRRGTCVLVQDDSDASFQLDCKCEKDLNTVPSNRCDVEKKWERRTSG